MSNREWLEMSVDLDQTIILLVYILIFEFFFLLDLASSDE